MKFAYTSSACPPVVSAVGRTCSAAPGAAAARRARSMQPAREITTTTEKDERAARCDDGDGARTEAEERADAGRRDGDVGAAPQRPALVEEGAYPEEDGEGNDRVCADRL